MEKNTQIYEVAYQVRLAINEEVKKDIAIPFSEGDVETADFLKEVMLDARLSAYSFLRWVDKAEQPRRILYPASGFDQVPKMTFGEDRIVHTSLEDENDVPYFEMLGGGQKVKADNNFLPFFDNSFQVVLLLDSNPEILGEHLDEFTRVLASGGVIVISRIGALVEDWDKKLKDYFKLPVFDEVQIPGSFQNQGQGEMEFKVLRKRL